MILKWYFCTINLKGMVRKCNTLLLIFLWVSVFYSNAQDQNKIMLDGEWQFRKAGTKEWFPARVPGTVHQDLIRNKSIPDPYFGDNESKLQWIGEIGWEYKKTFEYREDNFQWRNIDLVFEGIDTYANVYLNDTLILVANNMFRKWYVNVKLLLHIGTNTLRIQFPAIESQIKTEYKNLPFKLPGDEKVVCRKAAYHFGWDWGPKLVTSGIWKSVYLRHWNYVNVSDVNIIQKSLTDSLARMSVVYTLYATLADSANFRLFIDDIEILNNNVMLTKGVNVIRGDFTILNPELWWPNGMGNPKLYKFRYDVSFGAKVVGIGKKKVGLRTVELVRQPDSVGTSFYFRINGRPVFVKGANYIPQEVFLPGLTDRHYYRLLDDVRKSNMNMLRVWGGGIYENDIFYDLCDEYGIMVWQDFMFACAMYPGTKSFFDNVRDEAAQNIVRLRRHPSIVMWCGNNEIDEGWKNWGWQKQYGYSQQDSAAVYKDYRTLFDFILPALLRQLDTLRPYIPSSPFHGWGRPESMKAGDSHYWGVWWGKEPFNIFNKKVGRFMSEYGFQGFPDQHTIDAFTKPEDRFTGSPVMKAHQKHPTGYETIDTYLLRDYKKPRDFSAYGYVSQLLQAEGIKTAIEAHRRNKPYCMGTLYWQLNDCWPVVSWSSQDYFGRNKALGYRIPELFQKVVALPTLENGRIKIYVNSDDTSMVQAVMTVKVIDFDGNVYNDEGFAIEIPANSSLVYYDTLQTHLLKNLNPNHTALLVTLDGGIHDFRTRNLLYFVSPKDLILPVPEIRKSLKSTEGGYVLTISCEKLVKNVWLSSQAPGTFSDNYFDLLPNEKREIFFSTSAENNLTEDSVTIKSLIDSY